MTCLVSGGEVLLVDFLPLVDDCSWDFHILVVWRNCVWCLVADVLIRLLMVEVRFYGGSEYAALIGPCG